MQSCIAWFHLRVLADDDDDDDVQQVFIPGCQSQMGPDGSKKGW